MKKHILFLAIIFSFLSVHVFSQTVYITKTGEKYHNGNCRYISASSFAITLSEAIVRGYTPCSVCKPPSNTDSKTYSLQTPTQSTNEKAATQQANPEAQSVQCSANTKAATRCSRMTKSPNGKCWQHGGN